MYMNFKFTVYFICAPILLGAGFLSCYHNTNIPLNNNTPAIVAANSVLNKSIYYPDSLIDSISISDLNDSIVSVSNAWIGTSRLVEKTLGTKTVLLFYPGCQFGDFSGRFDVVDQQGGKCPIEYDFKKKYIETFDLFPINGWKFYSILDTGSVIKRSFISTADATLQFIFQADVSTAAACKTGIRSNFTVKGDFTCSIEFSLLEFFKNGYECGFFVSTTDDTGKWAGDVAGIYLSAINASTEIKCKSINGQVSSTVRDYFSGVLWLSKTDSTMHFIYSSMGNTDQDTLNKLNFPVNNNLFFHLRMIVDNRQETRSCAWNNFTIHKGTLVF